MGVHVSDYGKNNVDEVIDFLKENPLLMSFFFIDTAIDYENRKFPLPSYINYVTKDIEHDKKIASAIKLKVENDINKRKLKGNESAKKINDQKEKRSEESQKIIGQNNNN